VGLINKVNTNTNIYKVNFQEIAIMSVIPRGRMISLNKKNKRTRRITVDLPSEEGGGGWSFEYFSGVTTGGCLSQIR
jgi:hypothetical protein